MPDNDADDIGMHCRFAPQRLPHEARISQATRTEGQHPAVPRAQRRSWTREGPGRAERSLLLIMSPRRRGNENGNGNELAIAAASSS